MINRIGSFDIASEFLQVSRRPFKFQVDARTGTSILIQVIVSCVSHSHKDLQNLHRMVGTTVRYHIIVKDEYLQQSLAI